MEKETKFLREQSAQLARKLATSVIDLPTLEGLILCRLIPLNKNTSVRPIGIRKILWRIMGKAVGWCLKEDLIEATGPLQAASAFQGGLKRLFTP